MSTLGNILWFIFGGFFSGLAWVFSGLIWCITIIGIPYGRQCFKFDDSECNMGDIFRNLDGTRKFIDRYYLVYNHCGNTVWKAVFQACKAVADTFRGRDCFKMSEICG